MKNRITPFYNAQHSPLGAFASFTLGAKGAKGGFGIELGKPADQNVFIGLEDRSGNRFACLPFFDFVEDESKRFDVEGGATSRGIQIRHFSDSAIARTFTPSRDEWQAGDLTFAIHTPVTSAPDPKNASRSEMKLAYAPALAVELTVDNRKGHRARRVFFGFQPNDPYRGLRRLNEQKSSRFAGLACGDFLAIATDPKQGAVAQGFSPEQILSEKNPFNYQFGIGPVGLLLSEAPAGRKVTFRYIISFYRGGIVTTGLEAEYFYSRFFSNLESVCEYGLKNFNRIRDRGKAFDRRLAQSGLSPERSFMLAQAIHSYYGSTELLDSDEGPLWVVNEGEYRMMNTLDLTVDQLFFEMRLNPWTVRNELDWFVKRYAYEDKVYDVKNRKYPGGIAFTHDMGVTNHFSRPGYSSYEKTGLTGCFSHMTHEELVNWTVCALVYEHRTRDAQWLKKNLATLQRVVTSLVNRDHSEPEQRNGIMGLDSSRCSGGNEITTYDSLDPSLGQARNNLYLAVKTWGCYVGLEALFARGGGKKWALLCREQARRASETICGQVEKGGFLPSILGERVESRIIPAVEGLIIPYALGLEEALSERGPFAPLIRALKRHLSLVLVPDRCLFADKGWKISSASENSWLSKIYLCQFIAERILKNVSKNSLVAADRAHLSWLLDKRSSYWAWSDQMISGVATGSKYYPRGVTSILWLE